MSLNKFVSIKNIGRFQNYNAAGDVVLKRVNLVFAENGRGKSTLCAILRSVQSNDPAHVLGRATLGSTDAPNVMLLTDSGMVNFKAGVWTQSLPHLAIFDATFIAENVFSGDAVDLEHRRNLYRVIIGSRRSYHSLSHPSDALLGQRVKMTFRGGRWPNYTLSKFSWGAVPTVKTSDAIDLKARNVAAVIIDPVRAKVTCNVTIHVDSDGPIDVNLLGCAKANIASN
jgi:hypothetical protein